MKVFPKPRVVISRCIEFEHVRWDGGIISSDFVKQLAPHIHPIPVCPEVSIGLGVPRDPLRLVQVRGRPRLVQPSTGLDVTGQMEGFIKSFFDSLPEVDGFILKSRSPTSAIRDAKIYPNPKKNAAPLRRGPGVFGAAVLNSFPHLAIEDEGRLRNPRIREHFLTKIFALAGFREVKSSGSVRSLVTFHTENKLLLKAHSQKHLRVLGRIVARRDSQPFEDMIENYQSALYSALRRPPTCGSNVNVMMNALGYFSDHVAKEEKQFFLDLLGKCRNGDIPQSVPAAILRSWILRLNGDYLSRQTFFEPYPKELVDIEAVTAYCDGKDYWR